MSTFATKKSGEEHAGHIADVVIMAQCYLDAAKKEHAAVPTERREHIWGLRASRLNEYQKSIDYVLEVG